MCVANTPTLNMLFLSYRKEHFFFIFMILINDGKLSTRLNLIL